MLGSKEFRDVRGLLEYPSRSKRFFSRERSASGRTLLSRTKTRGSDRDDLEWRIIFDRDEDDFWSVRDSGVVSFSPRTLPYRRPTNPGSTLSSSGSREAARLSAVRERKPADLATGRPRGSGRLIAGSATLQKSRASQRPCRKSRDEPRTMSLPPLEASSASSWPGTRSHVIATFTLYRGLPDENTREDREDAVPVN